MPLPITDVFADLPDPRKETDNKLHLLVDILTLAVCAVIGGAEGSWVSVVAGVDVPGSRSRISDGRAWYLAIKARPSDVRKKAIAR